MSYNEVELYGRKIRVYSENHIEMEYRGKSGAWKVKPALRRKKYACISFKIGKYYKNIPLHRLVFYAHNPTWDILDSSIHNVIDHWNGNPLDNKIENLHCVTQQENNFNRSNVKGYYFHKPSNKWVAQIKYSGVAHNLGYFTKESDARDAYLEAKSKYHIIEERVFD